MPHQQDKTQGIDKESISQKSAETIIYALWLINHSLVLYFAFGQSVQFFNNIILPSLAHYKKEISVIIRASSSKDVLCNKDKLN